MPWKKEFRAVLSFSCGAANKGLIQQQINKQGSHTQTINYSVIHGSHGYLLYSQLKCIFISCLSFTSLFSTSHPLSNPPPVLRALLIGSLCKNNVNRTCICLAREDCKIRSVIITSHMAKALLKYCAYLIIYTVSFPLQQRHNLLNQNLI